MTCEFAKAAKYFDVDDEMMTATRIVLVAGGGIAHEILCQ